MLNAISYFGLGTQQEDFVTTFSDYIVLFIL
jgi:hypothetical protein